MADPGDACGAAWRRDGEETAGDVDRMGSEESRAGVLGAELIGGGREAVRRNDVPLGSRRAERPEGDTGVGAGGWVRPEAGDEGSEGGGMCVGNDV